MTGTLKYLLQFRHQAEDSGPAVIRFDATTPPQLAGEMLLGFLASCSPVDSRIQDAPRTFESLSPCGSPVDQATAFDVQQESLNVM